MSWENAAKPTRRADHYTLYQANRKPIHYQVKPGHYPLTPAVTYDPFAHRPDPSSQVRAESAAARSRTELT